MRITAKFDLSSLRSRFRGCPRVARRRLRTVLPKHGKAILGSIRRSKSIFDRTNTHKDSPSLQRSLWASQKNTSNELVQEMGWGVPYGPVLEHGPRKRRWIIPGPVGFAVGGGVQWASEVERVWTNDQKREHFGPAMEKQEPKFHRDAERALVESIEGGR